MIFSGYTTQATLADYRQALNSNKIDCATYLANYTCGMHDAPGVPAGDIITVGPGDAIAIGSVGFEIVSLDGSGNGTGIVKLPMFGNAKLGVEFQQISVAKGGCVVKGQAVLNSVDVAILSQQQRQKLAQLYAAYTTVLNVAEKYTDQIAEGLTKANAKANAFLTSSRANARAALAAQNQADLAQAVAGMQAAIAQQRAVMLEALKAATARNNAEQMAKLRPQIAKLETQQASLSAAVASTNLDGKQGGQPVAGGAALQSAFGGLVGSDPAAPALLVAYNGKTYKTNQSILISNKEAVSTFQLQNVVGVTPIGWRVLEGRTVINTPTANPTAFIWPDGKKTLTLEGEQSGRLVRLTLNRKTFTVSELIATDKNNTTRKALGSKGETLYLVRNTLSSRTVQYKLQTSAKASDFEDQEPVWTTTLPADGGVYGGRVLNGIHDPTGETRHTGAGAGTISAVAFDRTMGVKVEVMGVDKTKKEITPPFGLNQLFTNATNAFNQAGKLWSWGPCGDLELKPKITSSRSNYNEEEKNNRLYYNTTSYDPTFDISFSAKCGKSTDLPFVGQKVNEIIKRYIKLEVYVKPAVGFSIGGSIIYRRTINQGINQHYSNNIAGTLKGGVEAGIDLKLLDNEKAPVNITADVKGKAGIDLKLQLKYLIDEQKYEGLGEIVFKPLAVSGGLSIKTNEQKVGDVVVLPKFTLVDIKVEYTLIDERKFKLFEEKF